MQSRASSYVLMLFVLSSFALTACNDSEMASPTGPGRFTAMTGAVTAEPSAVLADFRAGSGCTTERPFDARIDLNVRPQQDMFVETIGFEFVDAPYNRRVRPLVFPGTFELNNAVLLPIPLPTSHPIPFPGEVKMSRTAVPAGAHFKAPFRLEFGCGVPARGTLFVSLETTDLGGTPNVSRTTVEIR